MIFDFSKKSNYFKSGERKIRRRSRKEREGGPEGWIESD
jgi:hypothetical protein